LYALSRSTGSYFPPEKYVKGFYSYRRGFKNVDIKFPLFNVGYTGRIWSQEKK